MSAADCLDRHLYDEHFYDEHFYASARPMAATSSPDGESPSHQEFPADVAAIRPAGSRSAAGTTAGRTRNH